MTDNAPQNAAERLQTAEKPRSGTSTLLMALTVFLAALSTMTLSGCSFKPSTDEPREVCIRSHVVRTLRGDWTSCDEYGIACLRPLKLDQKDGKLICRLREPNEAE
jgi:hypothetical protein